ncbi:MAG: tyrosine-type recombinase/integrase [Sagittula sp.]|uniref:tyrosine-type recombinase/integrase n=1 Tax=Sagittula sp. TaxID=2038081 RepID=UPI004057CF14
MARYLLTVKKVQALKEPGRYADGGGLYLAVGKGDARSWVMRIMQRGKRHDIGLGSAHFTTLAEARELAEEIRMHAKRGGDVETYIRQRREQAAGVMTVERAARMHFAEFSKGMAERTRDTWLNRLEAYVFPVIGHLKLEEITPREVKRVLEPIWNRAPDTAHRVRARLNQLFTWSIVEGHYPNANPVPGVELGLTDNSRDTQHHAALPWKELPGFMQDISARDGTAARCLEFLILTATRSIEARGARWSEIDFKAGVWTIPAERMKGPIDKRRAHRVPLSPEALAVLAKVKGLDSVLIFPSEKRGKDGSAKELSVNAFGALFNRMKREGITTHGFRSVFQDWTDDNGVFESILADKALAHVEKDKVKKAYARSDLFDRRIPLMNAWGAYALGIER